MSDTVTMRKLTGGTVEAPKNKIKQRLGIYVFIFDKQTHQKVLLIQMFNGKYTVPGGEKEPHETFLEGLQREVTVEECGIPFQIVLQLGFEENFVSLPDPEETYYHNAALFYLAVADSSLPLISRIQNGGKPDEYEIGPVWVDIDKIEKEILVTEQLWTKFQQCLSFW